MGMGLIVLLAFLAALIRLWITDGARIPLIFIGLWILGFLGFPVLQVNSYFFLAFEALLAVTLIIVEKCKSIL